MTWEEAVETEVARGGHARYRWLCSDANPNVTQRDGYRRIVIAKASSPPAYPSVGAMVGNAARAAAGFVASGFAIASEEEQARRLAVCETCEFFDAERVRCKHAKCGCFINIKKRIQANHCPIGKW